MSELINNNEARKKLLKHMILQLHKGETADAVKNQLIRLLGSVPYGVVVEVEQELISEGLPAKEILKLCDVHSQALKGVIDQSGAKTAAPGHPVHSFKQENRVLKDKLHDINAIFKKIDSLPEEADVREMFTELHRLFNLLMDIDKHYRRKENLLFPYLEKKEISGPPTVMWGKDDEIRELLKSALETIKAAGTIKAGEAKSVLELILKPAILAVDEMIYKEEEILLPMCMDILTDVEWFEIYEQSDEIGFCLYDPQDVWKPSGLEGKTVTEEIPGKIQLPTGNFSLEQLTAVLNAMPVDVTFVDETDTVRYFSQGKERIFDRNRAILGRKVQMCHPPSSVHVVQQILDDFKAGKQEKAKFWLNLKGRFIHIEYFAVRNEEGGYLGTLEVSQDLTDMRKLEGEQRLLNYNPEKDRKKVDV